MPETTKKMPMRLALRHEGNMWNAYVAKMDSMEGAFLLGSILIGAARDENVAEAFKQTMKLAMSVAIVDVTGSYPENWTEQFAPPHEKAGHS